MHLHDPYMPQSTPHISNGLPSTQSKMDFNNIPSTKSSRQANRKSNIFSDNNSNNNINYNTNYTDFKENRSSINSEKEFRQDYSKE
mmetsp:Transcript_44803/g.97907  ORF Transcript_44803/g.97907 Transcript_44803/m.97907 type:complete len:86 (+) Transcript_44803:317-574(+)